jgi:predicted Zn-dependent protease
MFEMSKRNFKTVKKIIINGSLFLILVHTSSCSSSGALSMLQNSTSTVASAFMNSCRSVKNVFDFSRDDKKETLAMETESHKTSTKPSAVQMQTMSDYKPYAKLIQMQGGVYQSDQELSQYINYVGSLLKNHSTNPSLPYEFTIINSSTPNAWVMGPGKIGITRGLILSFDNEAELAAVLAHEIAHACILNTKKGGFDLEEMISRSGEVIPNPSNERSNVQSAHSLMRPYPVEMEKEALALSIDILTRSGYTPLAAVANQDKYLRLFYAKDEKWMEGILSSHEPSSEFVDICYEITENLSYEGEFGQHRFRAKTKELAKTEEAYDRLDKALQAFTAKDYDEATYQARQGGRLAPNEARFPWLLGKIEMKYNEYSRAISLFDEAIDLDKTYFDNYIQRGICLAELGDNDDAYDDIEYSLSLLSTVDAHVELARLDEEDGYYQQASYHLEKAGQTNATVAHRMESEDAREQISMDPAKYVTLKAILDKDGYLNIATVNESPVSIRDISVAIEVKNLNAVDSAKTLLRFDEKIVSGGTSNINFTGIGPFKDAQELQEALAAEVIAAEFFDED